MPGENSKFGPGSWITLGSATAVATALFMAWRSIDTQVSAIRVGQAVQTAELKAEFQGVKDRLTRVESEVAGGVTFDLIAAWVALFKASNQGRDIVIPDFRRN